MGRKRYVIRLHKTVRRQLDAAARKAGHLTPTYVSALLEKRLAVPDILPYTVRDEEDIFQLKAGGMEKGKTRQADRQMSVYLSDFAYDRIGQIAAALKQTRDRSIGPAYVIRDILYGRLEGKEQ